MAWYLLPFWEKVKAFVRPTTAATRREEIVVKHAMPVQCFQKVMEALNEGDAEGIVRDSAGLLKPTKSTAALHKYKYIIRKGSVSDKIFCMSALDTAPPEPKIKETKTVETVAPGEEEDVYEVEAIVGKKTVNGRIKYNIKWRGWDSSTNTWEARGRIHPDLVRAYEGLPPRPPRPASSSERVPFKRGEGCARARLSKAEQRRGGVPTTMSMVAGNCIIDYRVPKNPLKCPSLKITFYILTMDNNGFITWPTNFEKGTEARLRKQARVLLKKMIDDPLNPCDETMAPALTQTGGSVRAPPPKRKLVAA